MDTNSSGATGAAPETFVKFGREQTEAALGMQQELLEAYEQANRVWLARMHSEIELWSDLANKLASARSIPDALGAYQESVSERVQMAADDGRRMAGECQQIMDKIMRSLSKGWPSASTVTMERADDTR